VLLLGAVGGGYLGVNRQHTLDNRPGIATDDVRMAELNQVPLESADQQRQAAVAAAQAKAAAAAAIAGAQAKRAQEVAKREQQAASRSETRSEPVGPVPTSCQDYTGNRAIGCTLLLDAGYELSQMPCLDKLWTKESGWNAKSENKSSGAYGIPQALPADKMAAYGSDYRTNPVPQIRWGLNYIKNRYDTPCGAWSFWQAHNWY
jgi:ribosomal protein L12E/L44/L45/RPP1/RPP2